MKPPRNTKNSNPTTPLEQPARKSYRSKWREEKEARGDYSNQKGHSKEAILNFGKAFKLYAQQELENPYSRRLTSAKFWLINDIHPTTPENWCLKYPEFKEDYDIAMMLIGVKREEGMMMRELSEKSTMYTMHLYLKYWDDANKYHAALRTDPKQTSTGGKTYQLIEMTDV